MSACLEKHLSDVMASRSREEYEAYVERLKKDARDEPTKECIDPRKAHDYHQVAARLLDDIRLIVREEIRRAFKAAVNG